MQNPNNTTNKQKSIETPCNTQALQVAIGTSLPSTGGGSAPVPVPPPPRVIGPVPDPPRCNTSSDTSMDEISLAILGAVQRIVSATIREQIATLVLAHTAAPSDVDVFEEEAEEGAPVPRLQWLENRGFPLSLLKMSPPPPTGLHASSASRRAYKTLGIRLKGSPRMNDKASPSSKK
ncbi:UNVERIFIED_CONTAM: hypothetical protein Sradi_3610300 [Sesamum radiatum]|uniref:Uncharacterized protein n=1 Tax=Sesamum radiatum TaxID=300843 RepID=A0AAW2QIE8_SESRA